MQLTRTEFLEVLRERGVRDYQAQLLLEQIVLLTGLRFKEVLPTLIKVREGDGWRIKTAFGSPLSSEEADEIIRRCEAPERQKEGR